MIGPFLNFFSATGLDHWISTMGPLLEIPDSPSLLPHSNRSSVDLESTIHPPPEAFATTSVFLLQSQTVSKKMWKDEIDGRPATAPSISLLGAKPNPTMVAWASI